MPGINQESEPTGLEIAVIGMAGKFPGAGNIAEFWENLKNGVESVSFLADEEIQPPGDPRELPGDPDYVGTKGGELTGKEFFDAPLFGYTPLEAEIMDPQARKLHEGVWEALENAGYNPGGYDGLIGLYAGASANFYWEGLTVMSGKRSDLGQFASAQLTGREFLATMVSYKLNLRGPSFTVLTACSTSLTALHLASQAILNGECHLAVAGGVSIETSPNGGYRYREGLIRSRDGHCRAFDARANGTAMGSGLGLVVLKALEEARADHDHIYAVIKGTAINNDGSRKGGYSAPSIEGQAEVIRAALQVAEVDPATIGYIETHGTGTELGDPIEIEALKIAFGPVKNKTCAIGSVKTNIGHLDAAAGAAGFIKAVLCLEHGIIPPSLHYEHPNPKIDFKNSPFYVNTTLSGWRNTHKPLRAAVSSFGIGGTNAHAILEAWPGEPGAGSQEPPPSREYRLILLSARTPATLAKHTGNLAAYIRQHPGINLADMAYTLQVGRKALPYRKMAVSRDINETLAALLSPAAANPESHPVKNEKPPVVFMFPGQGSQYENMGWGLYRTEPHFREQMDRCFDITKSYIDYNLKDILYKSNRSNQSNQSDQSNRSDQSNQSNRSNQSNQSDQSDRSGQSDIDQTEITQPLLFIFEYALAQMLMKWGIQPYAMIGHSIGEYVAAHLAGVFSLEDALKLVVLRGKSMQRMPPGAMLSVPVPAQGLQAMLAGREDICIAAVNTPTGSVVSGPGPAIAGLAAELLEKGCETRQLHTSHAFHSRMMVPLLNEFKENVARVKLNPPKIPYISNISGTWITVEAAVNPGYWAEHLTKPVLFSAGIDELSKSEGVIFVEAGPGKVLSTFVNQHPAKGANRVVVNLVRHPHENAPDQKYLTEKLGLLWLNGKAIDWKAYHENETRHRLPLPTYPFEKKRYWLQLPTGLFSPGNPGLETLTAAVNAVPAGEEEPPDARPALRTPYAAPGNETEKTLVKVWQTFFGINRLGILDDFFDLGGDSLKASALASKLQKELNLTIPFTELFNTPTIKGLAAFIQKTARDCFHALDAVEEKEYYPLSSAQKRLFLLQKMGLESTAYNLPSLFILSGPINRGKLAGTFKTLLDRHAGMRTSFAVVKGEPVQVIHREVEFKLEGDGAAEEAAPNIGAVIKNFLRPFDLSRAPLLRAGLYRCPQPGDFIFIIDMHHIITDGTSQAILTKEFMALYAGEKLPPLRLQYRDYSQWQQSHRTKTSLQKQEKYWLNEYAGEIPVLNLPTDYPRPPLQSFAGNAVFFELEIEITEKLHELARSAGVTLFVLLMAVFDIFLAKLSSREDIVVGIPSAGRNHADLQPLIGMFVNTLAVRSHIPGDIGFTGFLAEVKKQTWQALENQDYPFEDLVEGTKVKRDMSRNPLFDVMFVMQNTTGASTGIEKIEIGELTVKPYAYEHQAAKFDLTLTAGEGEKKLHFNLQYCTKLFTRETILRYISYIRNIVASILENPQSRIPGITMISPEEKKQVLITFNETRAPYPGDKTIHGIFEEQAGNNPGKIALARQWESVSYGRLDRQAGDLAHSLQTRGVGPGSIVGLMVENSIGMIAAILGILKAGAAYLPVDPGNPAERINYMLSDSAAQVLVTTGTLTKEGEKVKRWEAEKNHAIMILENHSSLSHPAPNLPLLPATGHRLPATSLAYLIYTSGTTGKPKGVLLTHSNVINYVHWIKGKAKLTPGDRAILTSSYAFDLGYTSVYPPLLIGAALHIVTRDTYMKPGKLLEYARENRVTYMKITPSLLSVIVRDPAFSAATCRYMRLMVVGGEPVDLGSLEKVHRLCSHLEVINHYGPTEATIGCIARYIDFARWEDYTLKPTIGKPAANTRVSILGRHLDLLPVGIPGELCISGAGLAQGYLNRPESTAEKFCLRRPGGLFSRKPSPWTPCKSFLSEQKVPGKNYDTPTAQIDSAGSVYSPEGRLHLTLNTQHLTLYKTGDLARWQPDGNIEFLGRIDTQVKIRGYRVETAEIENTLLKHDLIEKAAVVPRENENREKLLYAYIVAKTGISIPGIREYLLNYLPGYMVPSYYIMLEQIPLTPNGKVDKNALASYDTPLTPGVEYVAPGSDLEKTIAGIWQEVLQVEKVGIHSNFFELGGNSLKMIQVDTKIKEILGKEISVITLFEYTTIHTLAEYLRRDEVEENFLEIAAQRAEDMDEGKARLKRRMQRRGGTPDDEGETTPTGNRF